MELSISDTNTNRDGLTGLFNRKYGLEELEKTVATGSEVALIFADIDRFRFVNDHFGLMLSDEKIIEIAREIEELSGKNSLVSRIGGDEFMVMLPEASLEKARGIAEAIRAKRQGVHLKKWDNEEVIALTLSLGIAHFPTQVSSAENLLLAADLALLKAKRGGLLRDGTAYTARNRVMAIGDFPEQSARFLKPEWIIESGD